MTARTPIVIGNWKLHKTVAESTALVTELKNLLGVVRDVEMGVAPVFTALEPVGRRLADTAIQLGAQDCFYEETGAFTGEVSPSLLADVGCRFAIVGHSERRTLFGESDEIVAQKTRAVLDGGLMAVVCCGETEGERDSGQTAERVSSQLHSVFEILAPEDLANLVVAYEPIWAIGTGKTATPGQAQEVHKSIRDLLQDRFGDTGSGVRIQYGGSVKPGNISALMAEEDIDGALVGGASLNAQDFAAIVKGARPKRL